LKEVNEEDTSLVMLDCCGDPESKEFRREVKNDQRIKEHFLTTHITTRDELQNILLQSIF
jgi:hypothetical protein